MNKLNRNLFTPLLTLSVLIALVGCASNVKNEASTSTGADLSKSLLDAHKLYCGNATMADLVTSKKPPYEVVDGETKEISYVWVIIVPDVAAFGNQTNTKFGLSLTRSAKGGDCGVAFVSPEDYEKIKNGAKP